MTQEEKQILLIDLCGRLSYGVKISIDSYNSTQVLTAIDTIRETFNTEHSLNERIFGRHGESYLKPYLRPISSMTEEEEKDLCNSCIWLWFANDLRTVMHGDYKCYDWLNAHHFDYRGLIPMGLALEAPEDMYEKF